MIFVRRHLAAGTDYLKLGIDYICTKWRDLRYKSPLHPTPEESWDWWKSDQSG